MPRNVCGSNFSMHFWMEASSHSHIAAQEPTDLFRPSSEICFSYWARQMVQISPLLPVGSASSLDPVPAPKPQKRATAHYVDSSLICHQWEPVSETAELDDS